MKKYIEFINKAWKEFIEKDYLYPEVRKDIAESWKRCKAYGVDYTNGGGDDRYKAPVQCKIEKNAELIAVARPIMESIYSIVEGSGFAIILSDREGYIIDVLGDDHIMKRADELNFVKGALWTEEAVGTNAIGTAIHLDKPIQTIGAEHYGMKQHSWTCSAAPIYDEDGTLIGCINMSGNYYSAHSHTLGIVTSAAQSIQKQLALTISYNLLNITFHSIEEGMIVLDRQLNIKRINNRAENILGLSLNDKVKPNIRSILKTLNFYELINSNIASYNNVDCDFYINANIIKCIINVMPMKVNEKVVGLVITFKEAQSVHKLVNKMVGYKANYKFEDFITNNNKMKDIIKFAKKAAHSDCNVLIEGESGTGKEVIAQAIHNYSKRAKEPFVAVNCSSIPRELVESELFGYDRGAFSGANKEGNPGKFELADGGTIFLDEIGELPLDIQAKLLRVLDNNKITRVGGTYEKQLNIRVIGATNRFLKEEIKNKNFREDLYYRLNVMNIKTIPLRERKEDIDPLVNVFVEKLNIKNLSKNKGVSLEYIEELKKYSWPGNVRELRNIVERDYYLNEDNIGVTNDNVDLKKCDKNLEESNKDRIIPMELLEKESIKKALVKTEGNIVLAAKLLNISRATIYRKIKKYNINNV